MAISSRLTALAATAALAASIGCDRSDRTTVDTTPAPAIPAAPPVAAAGSRDASAPPLGMTPTGEVTTLGKDAAATGSPTAVTLTDAQALQIVANANQGELDQAGAATTRGSSDKVKTFAQHMTKDHTQAGKDLTALAVHKGLVLQDTDTSRTIDADGKATLRLLEAASTPVSFDRTYMDAQVKEHQDLLDLLDTRLIPSAKDDDVAAMLKKLRSRVADHLKMAREIDGALAS